MQPVLSLAPHHSSEIHHVWFLELNTDVPPRDVVWLTYVRRIFMQPVLSLAPHHSSEIHHVWFLELNTDVASLWHVA
jgi:hypothetical protein